VRLPLLLSIILWGALLIAVGIGAISGYSIFSCILIVLGLSIALNAFATRCPHSKCPRRGFLLLWGLLFSELGLISEASRYYSSLPFWAGIFIITLALSAYVVDRKYSIL